SEELARQADGILLLLDSSRPETGDDRFLLKKYGKNRTILIFNKIDLSEKMDVENILSSFPDRTSVKISALKKKNIHDLKETIYSEFVKTKETGDEVILHLRQKLLLEDILDALKSGRESFYKGFPEEIYAEEVRKSIPLISQLTGEIRSDDIIENIFSRFCIGK
ncbi:MAG TPA: tRNA uridine-5-carboxymethylaminomethyl(34) synthesis GTPase MnmE, partial [Candidatus Aminicenantes bacterium]|nr:tRNA uridine-5-carboxymethylaminomethyl(34) synthesis GTPase MnmE [Candidatus Aminicenantes bacterium]